MESGCLNWSSSWCPQKLPDLARSLGKGLAEFKKATDDFKSSIDTETRSVEEKEHLAKLAEAKLQAEAEKAKQAEELREKVESAAKSPEEPKPHAAQAEAEKKTA